MAMHGFCDPADIMASCADDHHHHIRLLPLPMQVPPQPFFWLSRRVWKVNLIGESVDDCGGGFSESVAEMCDELQQTSWSGLPVLMPCGGGGGINSVEQPSASTGGMFSWFFNSLFTLEF